MAPRPKQSSELSTNPHTVQERKRRAQRGFAGALIKRKRANQSSYDYAIKKLKSSKDYQAGSDEFKAAERKRVHADTEASLWVYGSYYGNS